MYNTNPKLSLQLVDACVSSTISYSSVTHKVV